MLTFTPHQYQRYGAKFIVEKQRCALFWDMGLGKTATTLYAMANCPPMFPALIVAPLRCVTRVWPTEIEKFGFDFSYSIVHGDDFRGANFGFKPDCNKSIRLSENTDVKITNYESLGWLVSELKRRRRVPFNSVIFDELSRLKTPTSKRTNYAQAIARRCQFAVGLTGTPIPSGYHDLWSETVAIGRGDVFGSYQNFLEKTHTEDYFGRPVLIEGADKKIETAIAPFTLRGDANELLDMPDKIEQTIEVELPERVEDRYDEVEYGWLNGLDDFKSHTEAPYAPLRCFCSGFLYHEDKLTGVRTSETIHETKLGLVESIRDELYGKPMLVGFNFRGERERLVDRFGCDFIDGSVSTRKGDALVDQWNAGELSMLAVHPAAVGHGLNMQQGGRHLVWYSLPDSGELYEQTVARLYRQGQTGTVHVYKIVTRDTIEQTIEGLLRRKLLTQENLLNAMKEKRK